MLQARVDGISWEFPTMGDPKVIQLETRPLRDPRHMLYAVDLYIYYIEIPHIPATPML
jgi:hypothetical protein